MKRHLITALIAVCAVMLLPAWFAATLQWWSHSGKLVWVNPYAYAKHADDPMLYAIAWIGWTIIVSFTIVIIELT